MQTVLTPLSPPADAPARTTAFTWEWLAYLALIALALALRLAGLNDVPLSVTETPSALAAWRAVMPQAPGDTLISASPLLFLLQGAGFTTLGGSEFAARLAVAVLGSALVTAPLLFRPVLGASTTFVLSLLLAFSPVLFVASRFSSPVIIAVALAVLALWAAERYRATRLQAAGITAVVALAALVFLSEPGGPALAVILAAAFFIAHAWERSAARRAFDFEDDEDAKQKAEPDAAPAAFPWALTAAIAGLVVFLAATAFLLYPAGLSQIGELLSGALRGFLERPAGRPAAFPLLTALFYEPFLVGLGIAGAVVLWQRGAFTFIDRFLCAWALAGAVGAALFGGGEPAHALWVTLPLTVLAARLAVEVLQPDSGPRGWDVPYRARFIAAGIGLVLLLLFSFALQAIARDLSLAVNGVIWTAPIDPASLILLLVSALLILISIFLGTSLYDGRTVLRGMALALLIFGAITSLGAGWRAAVTLAESAFEFWHPVATDNDAHLLSNTLDELDDRQARGFTLLPMALLTPQDSVTSWLTRAYSEARFVSDPSEAAGEPVVIIDSNIVPELGGPYVGQDFTITRSWSLEALPGTDVLAWWTQGRVGPGAASAEVIGTAYLWVRQDVWQGSATTQP